VGTGYAYVGPGGSAPPQELAEQDIDIEFISLLAQAQRVVSVNGMERMLTQVMSMGQVWPEMVAKVNPYAVVDDLAEAFSNVVALVVLGGARGEFDAGALCKEFEGFAEFDPLTPHHIVERRP
jgi:hypothetical protein